MGRESRAEREEEGREGREGKERKGEFLVRTCTCTEGVCRTVDQILESNL